MAIELTTASDSQKKLIRDSLRALGVSGNNTFILNGDILATRSITITGNLPFGDSPALQIPNGRIKLGYMPDYGDLNDGTYLYNDRVGNDYIEFRIETVDNGGEPIVLRQNDSIGGNLYENIVVGQDHKVGINVPTGLRSFPSTLSVFGNISASGSLFVQSIVQDSSNPLVVDVNTAVITNSANWNTSFSRVSANDVVYSNPVRETSSTGMSAVGNIVAMTQTGYDTLAVKLSSTLYIIV